MKKTVLIVVMCIVAALMIFRCETSRKDKKEVGKENNYLETHYIFDKNFRISHSKTDFTKSKYDYKGMISADTLRYFRFLGQKFTIKSPERLEEHYQQVEQYLQSQFSETDARKLIKTYRQYLDCQISLARDSRFQIQSPDLRQILNLLSKIQNYRREKMGKETADALFGGEIKEKEYFVRREMIVANEALYGKDKEGRLEQLRKDMWEGSVPPAIPDDNDYNRYRFKMQMYERDFKAMNAEERGKKIAEFREEFFTPEQIEKLREVDKQMDAEEENLKRYREAERKLLLEKGLTETARSQKIRALQDEFFGQEAEAFRREEDIRKSLEK